MSRCWKNLNSLSVTISLPTVNFTVTANLTALTPWQLICGTTPGSGIEWAKIDAAGSNPQIVCNVINPAWQADPPDYSVMFTGWSAEEPENRDFWSGDPNAIPGNTFIARVDGVCGLAVPFGATWGKAGKQFAQFIRHDGGDNYTPCTAFSGRTHSELICLDFLGQPAGTGSFTWTYS